MPFSTGKKIYFIRKKHSCSTLKLNTGANHFAAHLLIDDDLLEYYEDFTREQFCNCRDFQKELIELRLPKDAGSELSMGLFFKILKKKTASQREMK